MLCTVALGFTIYFIPDLAPVLTPPFAALKGVLIGAACIYIDPSLPIINIEAILGTIVVFFLVLLLYESGWQWELVRTVSIVTLMATSLTYFISYFIFHRPAPLFENSDLLPLGTTAFAIFLTSLNLIQDFDFVEHAARKGAPRSREWYAVFGLLLSLIWLYIDFARALARRVGRQQ